MKMDLNLTLNEKLPASRKMSETRLISRMTLRADHRRRAGGDPLFSPY